MVMLAFPFHWENKSNDVVRIDGVECNPGSELVCVGMTLRDYFAAKALQGDWAVNGAFNPGCSDEDISKSADIYYRMADAMMKARQK